MLKIVLALLCATLLPPLHSQTSATEKTAAAAVPSVFTFDDDSPGKMRALPGGFRTMISGIGVFYPDKKPSRQIGIVPDKIVYPTIEGIREGRDEVLEEGIRQIIGANAPLPDIQPTIAKK